MSGWMLEAACAGKPSWWFFPDVAQTHAAHSNARPVCEACPVREQCLEHALTNHIDHGMWGGYSERERRRIKKGEAARRRAGRPPLAPGEHEFSATGAYLKAKARRDAERGAA